MKKSYTRGSKSNKKKRSLSRKRKHSSSLSRPNRIPSLRRGTLSQFGYHADRPSSTRHRSLHRAVNKEKDALKVFRKLIAVSTLNKNTNPKKSHIFHQDAEWIKREFM